MNTPVKFEIAKLLKEKGFDKITESLWHFNGSECIKMPNKNSENLGFSAPTIAEVVMWCFDKYGIWVYADYYNENRWFGVFRTKEGVKKELFDAFNTPTEAYEAAIEYTLNNLI